MQVKKQQLEPDVEQQTGSKLGKEYIKAVYCHPAYLTLYAEYTMRNAGLDEAQPGIKTSRRNINNLRYADDTTLMAESEEELKSLLIKVEKESEKAGLQLNIQKLRSWHPVPSLHGKKMGKQWEPVTEFILGGSKITGDGDCSHEIKRRLLLGKKL